MKLRLFFVLIGAFLGLHTLKAQNNFSLQIPDSLGTELLHDFQNQLGEVLYEQIKKNNLALYKDEACTRKMMPDEVTDVFRIILEVDILDPETMDLKTILDTLQIQGHGWDSIRWNRKSVCIYTVEGRRAYIKTADCINVAANDPWVKKALHMLLLHKDQFFLSEEHNRVMGQALVDSLQGKLQNALLRGDLAAYADQFDSLAYTPDQLDSIFNQTVTILVEEDGELMDHEMKAFTGPSEQTGFLLFGTSHGNMSGLQIDFTRLAVLAEYWEIEAIYPMYFSHVSDIREVLGKNEQLLLELLIQHALNPLEY